MFGKHHVTTENLRSGVCCRFENGHVRECILKLSILMSFGKGVKKKKVEKLDFSAAYGHVLFFKKKFASLFFKMVTIVTAYF